MKRLFTIFLIIAFCGVIMATPISRRNVEITSDVGLIFNQVSAPAANPADNTGWLYVKDNAGDTTLYFEDDAGTVTVISGISAPGGSDTYMQYNNGGAFGGIAGFLWDDTNIIVNDEIGFAFGSGVDWTITYDENVDDQLLFETAAVDAGAITDPMLEILVDTGSLGLTADQQVFGIAKGSQSSNTPLFTVDEDGDVIIAGTLTVTGSFIGDITLSNDETITNTTNSEIQFTGSGGEDFAFDMNAASNTIGLTTTSGVTGLAFGVVDDLSGVGTIAFDQAASSISLVSDGTDDNLTIALTGATASSIIISSTGTGADAIDINTTAGGIDIDISGAGSNEDFSVTTDSSIHFTPTEAATDSFEISASGGIDITAVDDISIVCASTAGADDLVIQQTGANDSSISLQAAGTGADAINIDATAGGVAIDGTNSTIIITNTTNGAGDDLSLVVDGDDNASIILDSDGTANDAILLTASGGGIDINGKEMITIDVASGTAGTTDIIITNTPGTDEAAIAIQAVAGGVDIDAAAAKNVAISGGQVLITSKTDEASAISMVTNVGTSETIVITNTLGEAAGSIALEATAGGITAKVADEKELKIGNAALDAYFIIAASGTVGNEDARVVNTNGTNAAAVELVATAGGITFTSTAGVATGDPITGDGTAALGGFLQTITNDGEPHAVTAAESGTVLTNAGSDGADAWTLPTAVAGYEYTFVVMAVQSMKITPASGDSILGDGVDVAPTHNYAANAIGETLHLIAVDNTNWIIISETGTWVDSGAP